MSGVISRMGGSPNSSADSSVKRTSQPGALAELQSAARSSATHPGPARQSRCTSAVLERVSYSASCTFRHVDAGGLFTCGLHQGHPTIERQHDPTRSVVGINTGSSSTMRRLFAIRFERPPDMTSTRSDLALAGTRRAARRRRELHGAVARLARRAEASTLSSPRSRTSARIGPPAGILFAPRGNRLLSRPCG